MMDSFGFQAFGKSANLPIPTWVMLADTICKTALST